MGGHVDRVGNVERVRPSGGGVGGSIASLEQRFISLLSLYEFIIYDILPLRMQSCK